jgi:hypothetical protein
VLSVCSRGQVLIKAFKASCIETGIELGIKILNSAQKPQLLLKHQIELLTTFKSYTSLFNDFKMTSPNAFYTTQYEAVRLWSRPNDLINDPDFIKRGDKLLFTAKMGDRQLKTTIELYKRMCQAHIQTTLSQAIDRGHLDLQLFDEVTYDADLEIDGEALGALEDLEGNAEARRGVEERNRIRRRRSFFYYQIHLAFVYYFFSVSDAYCKQKAYQILIREWSTDTYNADTAHAVADANWELIVADLAKGALQQQESHPRVPLLEFLCYSTNRILWQKANPNATSDRYLEHVYSSLIIITKGFDIDLKQKLPADLVWGHLRTFERSQIRGKVFGDDDVAVKDDFKHLLEATTELSSGALSENYYDRDSLEEEKLLATWLGGPIGSQVLAYWNKLAGRAALPLPRSQLTTKIYEKKELQISKRENRTCTVCGKMAKHLPSECKGKD